MPTPLISLLLCAAIALLYWADCRQRPPVVTICRCGDMVQHAPGWPTSCPSCKGLLI